jgi:hypothetical protein
LLLPLVCEKIIVSRVHDKGVVVMLPKRKDVVQKRQENLMVVFSQK